MLRAARFIWSPRQQWCDDVSFRSLLVDGPVRRTDGRNRWFLFRREFELPAMVSAGRMDVTADSRYLLYVNGQRIGRGPARAAPAFLPVDSYDVTAMLQPGMNACAVLVHVYGVDTAWYEVARDYAQAIFGDGGLYLHATIRCGATAVELRSDRNWRVTECAAWNSDTPRSGWGQGFIEDHDARLLPENWTRTGCDDSQWDEARELLRPATPLDLSKGWGDIEPFPTLVPRAIPPLVESVCLAGRIVAVHDVQPVAQLPLDRRLYEEPLLPLRDAGIRDADALLRDDDSHAVITTTAGHDAAIVIEFPLRHAGYPFIELDACGGEVIEVAVAETIPGQYGDAPAASPRIARASYLDCAHLFRYTARPGRQRFEKFEWTAVKFLQLVVRNAPAGLRIRCVGSTRTHYPVELRGAFACSDALLTRLWEIGRYTSLQCTHDAWEDCPSREKRQWLGDGIVHYLIHAAAFGPGTQPIDRRFLLQATESQRTDGLLEMFAPGDHHVGGIVIPDFNLHWICAAHHYLMHTGDVDTIARILPTIQRALDWFERQSGDGELLADLPHWHFIEWARVGRSGEAFAVNALWAGALQAAAALAEAVGYARLGAACSARAQRIRAALRARHQDAGRSVFVDCVDPRTRQQQPQVSQQANALAILYDIATPAEWPGIVARITDRSRCRRTAAPPVAMHEDPFDPETDVVAVNTYYCHFLYAALGRAGRFDLALAHMREHYGPMLATGTETLWESFEPVASLCHAFSATPVYQLSAHVLGVTPLSPGFARARIAPQLVDLRSASGRYPTPHGELAVEWSRDGESGLEVRIDVPAGIEAEFVVPPGYQEPPAARQLAAGTHRWRLPARR